MLLLGHYLSTKQVKSLVKDKFELTAIVKLLVKIKLITRSSHHDKIKIHIMVKRICVVDPTNMQLTLKYDYRIAVGIASDSTTPYGHITGYNPINMCKKADLGELKLFEAYRDYTTVTWISMIGLRVERCLLDFILFFK